MPAGPVFLTSATADYAMARDAAQVLTDRGIPCFFCDEARLRAGEPGYSGLVLRELEAATNFLNVCGDAKTAHRSQARDLHERFLRNPAGQPGRRVFTLMGEGMTPADLPDHLHSGPVVRLPVDLPRLPRILSGGELPALDSPAMPPPAPAAGRRSVRLIALLTLANVGLFCGMAWLLHEARTRAAPATGDRATSPSARSGGNAATGTGNAAALPAAGGRASAEDEAAPSSAPSLTDAMPDAAAPGQAGVEHARQSSETLSAPPLAPEPGQHWSLQSRTDPALTVEFSWIPAGTMGSTSARPEHGSTAVTISISGFWLARTECTQALWISLMGANPSAAQGDPRLPVEMVSWDDIAGPDGLLDTVNARLRLPDGWHFALPGSTPWEYACRAGTTTPFSFGSILDGTQANCDGDVPYGTYDTGIFLGGPAPVGSYPPNPWGLYDMHGNVWEWVAAAPDGDAAAREFRGGSWNRGAIACRADYRQTARPDTRDDTIGFRLAIVQGAP